MPIKSFRQAVIEALDHEMGRDPSVFLIGEDVAGGTGCEGEQDAWGSPFGQSKGLYGKYGPMRIVDATLTEGAFTALGLGAAVTGMRPVVDLMFNDFFSTCADQVLNQIPKQHFMFGGQDKAPMVIKANQGAGTGSGPQHSQALHAIFTYFAGLKVVVPSNAYDCKGLLIQAIRDDSPVVFLEHKLLFDDTADVPDEAYTIPFGEAEYITEGDDVTIVAVGYMVKIAQQAAAQLAKEGIEAEILDLRTTSPLDLESIVESVENTGKLVIVDEGSPRCGFAADVAAQVTAEAFADLDAAPKMVTSAFSPIGVASGYEQAYLPNTDKVVAAVKELFED